MQGMEDLFEFDLEGLMRFARSVERDCQEGVKWERRKLEWILEERAKADRLQREAV